MRHIPLAVVFLFGCGTAPVPIEGDGGVIDAASPDAGPPLDPLPWAVRPVLIAVGETRACAVLEDGRVACWGASARTALGPDTESGCERDALWSHEVLELVPAPTIVEGVADAVEVAVAIETTCARTRAGEVLCWGRSFDEECEVSAPRPVPGVTDVVQLRATSVNEGICAVHGDGTVTCWTSTHPPRTIAGVSGVRSLAVTGFGSCAIVADDRVRCFAHSLDDPRIQDHVVSDAREIAARTGDDFCLVDSSGGVRCWRYDPATRDVEETNVPALPPVSGIALAFDDACAWSIAGEVHCYGNNARGQLGVGTTEAHRTPVRVAGLDDVSQVAMSDGYACALRRSGGIACWGTGWLGNGEPLYHYAPVEVPGISRAVRASSSRVGSCAIDDAGVLRCWGQLRRSSDPPGSLAPAVVPTRGPVREACGSEPVLLVDGTVQYTFDASHRPTISALEGVEDIACGANHECVIANGVVQCAGSDFSGQLGDGRVETTGRAGDPLTSLGEVVELAAGHAHTCARTAAGDVYCWGDNRRGQAGGTSDVVLEPTLVARGADRVIAGGETSCAARAGTWSCWGDLYVLRELCESPCDLPIGSSSEVALPFAADRLALSRGLTCAVLGSGPVRCTGWASTLEGYSWGTSAVTMSLPGTEDTVDLVASDRHACAVASDGRVRCWGLNDRGQLGGERAGSHSLPVSVLPPE